MEGDDIDSDGGGESTEVFSYEQNCELRKVRVVGSWNRKKERIGEFIVARCKAVEVRDPFTNRNNNKPWRRVSEGSSVLISGEDASPLMAHVHGLYKIHTAPKEDKGAEALLKVTWLYRESEVKATNKRPSSCKVVATLNKKKESASVKEVYYTAHSDHVLAQHVIHPCVVHFQRSNDQLPYQEVKIGPRTVQKPMKGFVCRRFYDTSGRKCYDLGEVADDIRAIIFEDHLVLEVQVLLKASRNQIAAWQAHVPRWYLEKRPWGATGFMGEGVGGDTEQGVTWGVDMANQSAGAEGKKPQHGLLDGVKGSPSNKRQRTSDHQDAVSIQKCQKTDGKQTPLGNLVQPLSDKAIPETEAERTRNRKKRQASTSPQISSSEDDEPGDSIPLMQRYRIWMSANRRSVRSSQKLVCKEDSEADPTPYVTRHGDMFEVKIPKEFTHSGETRTELVFGGRFKSKTEAERACIAAMKMDHSKMKEYVKANAAKLGADPLTGRPPIKPLFVVPGTENKSHGLQEPEELSGRPRDVRARLRHPATTGGEASSAFPTQEPTRFNRPPSISKPEVQQRPCQGGPIDEMDLEKPVHKPTSPVLTDRLAQPPSLPGDSWTPLGSGLPCRCPTVEEQKMVARVSDEQRQQYKVISYKAADGTVIRHRLMPEEDLAAMRATEEMAGAAFGALDAEAKKSILLTKLGPVGTAASEPCKDAPESKDPLERKFSNSDTSGDHTDVAPEEGDRDKTSLMAGKELEGKDGPPKGGSANGDMQGPQLLSGYYFRNCLICMEHRFVDYLQFKMGFLEATVSRCLWDMFLRSVDQGAHSALVLKVDASSSASCILANIRQPDCSGKQGDFKYALLATEWVLAWPEIELEDGIEELQECRGSCDTAGCCPSGHGAYIEDEGGVVMGGCLGMGVFDVWMTVGVLVQLGYLEEPLPACTRPKTSPERTLVGCKCDDMGLSFEDGVSKESEESSEEIDIG